MRPNVSIDPAPSQPIPPSTCPHAVQASGALLQSAPSSSSTQIPVRSACAHAPDRLRRPCIGTQAAIRAVAIPFQWDRIYLSGISALDAQAARVNSVTCAEALWARLSRHSSRPASRASDVPRCAHGKLHMWLTPTFNRWRACLSCWMPMAGCAHVKTRRHSNEIAARHSERNGP